MITFGIRHHHLLNTLVGYNQIPGAHSMMNTRQGFTAEQIFQELTGYPTREISELVAVECDIVMRWLWGLCDRLEANGITVGDLRIVLDKNGGLHLPVKVRAWDEDTIMVDLMRDADGSMMVKVSAECATGVPSLPAASEVINHDRLGLQDMGFSALHPIGDEIDEIFASVSRLRDLVERSG